LAIDKDRTYTGHAARQKGKTIDTRDARFEPFTGFRSRVLKIRYKAKCTNHPLPISCCEDLNKTVTTGRNNIPVWCHLDLRILVLVLTTAEIMAGQPVSYNLHVRPILADRCFKCHGRDEGNRQMDLRLTVRPRRAFSGHACRKLSARVSVG